MSEKKIMSYPFTGFDYKDIMEIANRVRIHCTDNSYDVSYIVPVDDIDGHHEVSVTVNDDIIKNTLCYFNFLNSMRRYNCEVPIFMAIDRGLLSYNTYIDTILICTNEIVSECKYFGVKPDSAEILSRFGKQFNPNDLNRLHSNKIDYNYIEGLFRFLAEDSYLVHVSKFKKSGIFFNKMHDGFLDNIVSDIINNKDDVEFFKSSKEIVSEPQLTKKLSKPQVI
ncbi:MAG: hypothetical protein ACI31V_04655 [Bacilli bacterium]